MFLKQQETKLQKKIIQRDKNFYSQSETKKEKIEFSFETINQKTIFLFLSVLF